MSSLTMRKSNSSSSSFASSISSSTISPSLCQVYVVLNEFRLSSKLSQVFSRSSSSSGSRTFVFRVRQKKTSSASSSSRPGNLLFQDDLAGAFQLSRAMHSCY